MQYLLRFMAKSDDNHFDRFNNLSLKLKIEEGNMTFSDSQIMWRDNINLSLSEGLLIFEDEKIDFNGSVIVNIKDAKFSGIIINDASTISDKEITRPKNFVK